MDCNKEDAIKAQKIAEGRLALGDYAGAKKFILKSQHLFPSLSGLPQMLALVDVHINLGEAGNDLSENWRKILQLDECADEETVRKQYRKLVLLLHPDKNKYGGAESAFKMVQSAHEAFEKEKEYIKLTSAAGVTPRFWTVCTQCKAPSEHLETLEHHYVQCPQCLRSFQAVRPPSSGETSQCRRREDCTNDLNKTNHEEMKEDEIEGRKGGLADQIFETLLSSSSSSSFEDFERKRSSTNAQTKRKETLSPLRSMNESGSKVRQKHKGPKEKRDRAADNLPGKRKRASSIEEMDVDYNCDMSSKEGHTQSVNHSIRKVGYTHSADVDNNETTSGCNLKDIQGAHSDAEETSQQRMKGHGCMQDTDYHHDESTHQQKNQNIEDDAEKDTNMKSLVFERIKSTIINEFKSGNFQVVDIKRDNLSESVVDAEEVGSSAKAFRLKMDISFIHAESSTFAHIGVSEDCMVGGSEIWEEDEDSVECQVPDNDVFNFDDGRQEDCFEAGQIWAIYDDADGLPRFYAQIFQVISVRPFHVLMRWLYPKKAALSEEAKAWTDAGFAYTCGEFSLGKKVSRKSVCMFSHRMAHVLGEVPRFIHIYPQKGDVWALYKTWKPQKGGTRKCEAVVVLSEYSKELGIQVATLFQVAGFKSIYCRKGTEGFCNIPATELLRFSHQIPAHYLVGHEVSNLSEAVEWVDLDTAAFM